MIGWEQQMEEILDQAPTRALAFSELMKAVRARSAGPSGGSKQVLRRMKDDPERFQVVPGRLGPWAYPVRADGTRHPLPLDEPEEDPWILFRIPPRPSVGSEGRIVVQIQESLRAWGQELDTASQRAVARWIQANWEAAEALSRFLTSRGPPS